MSEGIEYQVYHPAFEPFMEPVAATTEIQAESILTQLNRTLGGWHIRSVNLGKEPIPPQAPVTTPITVHEGRKIMAKHGQDILVMVAWSKATGNVNIVTAGSDRKNSEEALALGEAIGNGLNLQSGERLEDRRAEHPA